MLTFTDLHTCCDYVDCYWSTDLFCSRYKFDQWLSLCWLLINDLQTCCLYLNCHWSTDLLSLFWLSLIYRPVFPILTVIDLYICRHFVDCWSMIYRPVVIILTVIDLKKPVFSILTVIDLHICWHFVDCWSMIYKPVITTGMLTVIYLHICSHYVDCHWSTQHIFLQCVYC